MQTKNKIKQALTLGLFFGLTTIQYSHAQSEVRNGGDVLEKRFNQIADDLQDWLNRGGDNGLTLPEILTHETYKSGMLKAIAENTVSFTTDTILVNGVEKDCENIPANKMIRCNIDRFKKSTESEQYVIVHHEYAGLAGFEANEGKARSNYFISDQITGSLEKVTILKLKVKKVTPEAVMNQSCNILVGGYGDNKDKGSPFSVINRRSKRIIFDKHYNLTIRKSKASLIMYVESTIVDGSVYAHITIQHLASGYTRVIESSGRITDTFPIDPRNAAILEKMKLAKNVKEYTDLKDQLNPDLNKETITHNRTDLIFKGLPSCEEILGDMKLH